MMTEIKKTEAQNENEQKISKEQLEEANGGVLHTPGLLLGDPPVKKPSKEPQDGGATGGW